MQLLRSRQSVINHTPRKAGGLSGGGSSGSADHLHRLAATATGKADPSTEPNPANITGDAVVSEATAGVRLWAEEGGAETGLGAPLTDGAADMQDRGDDWEREQRLLYLRQAFCGFFRAKQGVEMQNLARVMCAILGVDDAEQAVIMESIARLVPALVATTTLETLSYNFSSLFS